MVIAHNVPALYTHLSMRRADRGLQQAMFRLSSGLKINSAKEDAAGLAIANKLNYQVGGLRRASENATHGISLIQTAEGALNEVHNMLQRIRELSVQAAHGTLTNENRAMIQLEIEQLTTEINSIARNTEYNRMRILNGEANRVTENSRVPIVPLNIPNPPPGDPLGLHVPATPPTDITIPNPPVGDPHHDTTVAEGVLITITNPPVGDPLHDPGVIPATRPNPPYGAPGHVPASGLPEATRNVVSTLYVSPQVPPGHLNYVIHEAGRGAMAQLTPDLSQMIPETDPETGVTRMLFPPDTGFTINGKSIVLSNREWEEVRAELNHELQFFGLSLHEGLGASAGSYFLVSNKAGSDQFITLTGDLGLFGMVEDDGAGGTTPLNRFEDRGRDARVSASPMTGAVDGNGETIAGGLFDLNGNPVAGASLGTTAVGNQVFFRGSMGEDIRMNIQVAFNPETAEFEFADGTSIRELHAGGSYTDGMYMRKDFRPFGPIMLQIGPSHNTAMPVQIPRLNAETLGLIEYVGGKQRLLIDVRPTAILTVGGGVRQVGADAAIDTAEAAILTVSDTRARLGAYQNRLESTVRNLDVAAENTEISRSRIQDTDMAREMTSYSQYNVMYQAAMAILSHANQRPQQILQLLQ